MFLYVLNSFIAKKIILSKNNKNKKKKDGKLQQIFQFGVKTRKVEWKKSSY